MTLAPISRFSAALLIIAGLVGCQHDTDAPRAPATASFANWPEALDGLRFRWTAEPGIELLTGPAVPLRAYLESHRIGDMTGNPDDAYPGFERAVPEQGKPADRSSSDLPFQLWNIQPATEVALRGLWKQGDAGQRIDFYGNEYFHILDLAPIEGGWRAYVCDGLYNMVRAGDAGSLRPVYAAEPDNPDPDPFAVQLWRVELTKQAIPQDNSVPPVATVPQKGPYPAPVGDVFGPWQITGADFTGAWGAVNDRSERPGGTYPNYPQLNQQCRDKMPHDAAQRQGFYASHPTSPPAAEPAVPGWPTETA